MTYSDIDVFGEFGVCLTTVGTAVVHPLLPTPMAARWLATTFPCHTSYQLGCVVFIQDEALACVHFTLHL